MKITFSGAGIVEMSGKAQGTIIQKSYGGYQLRKLTLPNKRRTNATQGIRKNFAFVNSSWRSLTNEQRETWNSAAPDGVSGFEFYSSYNLAIVNSGGTIIPSFVAPVSNPPESLVNIYTQTYQLISGVNAVQFYKLSGNNAIPLAPWRPAFLWTGWISPSIYSYPRMNRAISPYMPDYAPYGYYVFWYNIDGTAPFPPAVGFKCKYIERWINEETGQVYTGETFEIIAGETSTTPRPIQCGPTLISAVLSGDPGEYTLVTTWEPNGDNFDEATWEPLFYMNSWGTGLEADDNPYVITIEQDAINIVSPTSMIITFGGFPVYAPGPIEIGQWAGIGFNWKNIISGQESQDSAQVIEANDYP